MKGEWRRGEYFISTDKSLLDLAMIHGFLKGSYWAAGTPTHESIYTWLSQNWRKNLVRGILLNLRRIVAALAQGGWRWVTQ